VLFHYKKILVTGGCGFIGSNFIKYIIREHPTVQIINLDLLTYAGNPANLSELRKDKRYKFIKGDIADQALVNRLFKQGLDAVINFAAESHVDRSLYSPGDFIKTNILGTQVLIEAARQYQVARFLQVSTDEVYGSIARSQGAFTETSPLDPSSPYSVSKTAADLLVKAYEKTHGYKALITRCTNNYGPYQFPEKMIPLFITNALENKPLPLYGDGLNIRDWIYVEDHCRGLDTVLRKGTLGEIYNIGGLNEKTNLEITKRVLKSLGKTEALIKHVKDRPGHDRRYALDISKIRKQLNWRPIYQFDGGMKKTIDWYVTNELWWRKIKTGEYRSFYQKHYKKS
jgi:dTDP-glucose 4,6-dehydratase